MEMKDKRHVAVALFALVASVACSADSLWEAAAFKISKARILVPAEESVDFRASDGKGSIIRHTRLTTRATVRDGNLERVTTRDNGSGAKVVASLSDAGGSNLAVLLALNSLPFDAAGGAKPSRLTLEGDVAEYKVSWDDANGYRYEGSVRILAASATVTSIVYRSVAVPRGSDLDRIEVDIVFGEKDGLPVRLSVKSSATLRHSAILRVPVSAVCTYGGYFRPSVKEEK